MHTPSDSQHIFRALFWMIVIGFLANFAWEILQMPLYATAGGLFEHIPLCIQATRGDVLAIVTFYIVLAMMHSDWFWMKRITLEDIAILLIAGGLIGIGIEQHALAQHTWAYAPAMPLIPILHVGVVPVLQMMVLPLGVFYCVGKIVKEKSL